MITELIDAARALRGPLTFGYSFLLAGWIIFGEWAERATEQAGSLAFRFDSLLGQMGSTTRFAFWTFVAYSIGSLLWNGGGRWATERLYVTLGRGNDWAEYADAARRRLIEYESVRSQKGEFSLPSAAGADELRQPLEDRERQASEVRYRIVLGLAALPVVAALASSDEGSRWWLMVLALPVLDLALMNWTTAVSIHRGWLEAIEDLLRRAQAELASAEAKRADEAERLEELLASVEASPDESSRAQAAREAKKVKEGMAAEDWLTARRDAVTSLQGQRDRLKNTRLRKVVAGGFGGADAYRAIARYDRLKRRDAARLNR